MNVVIHPVHFDASTQLVDFINKKLEKLETFFDRIVEAEVFLKLESRQNVKDKIVEIKVHVPGKKGFKFCEFFINKLHKLRRCIEMHRMDYYIHKEQF